MVATQGTIAAAFMRQVADVVEQRFGIAQPALDPGAERLPLSTFYDLLAKAAATHEGPIGFDIARSLTVMAFEELGFLVRSCPTLGASIEVALRFMRNLSDETLRFERDGDTAWVGHTPLGPPHPGHRPATELMLGDLVFGLPPVEVEPAVERVRLELRGAPRGPLEPYEAAAGVSVVFDAPTSRVVLPAALLDLPMPRADPELAALMEARVQARAAALPPLDDVVERTCAAIRSALGQRHMPVLADIARALATSDRSLHRSLAREGQRFGRLLDRVRADEDVRLRAEGRTATEIAEALGFSSTNAYYRARARWKPAE